MNYLNNSFNDFEKAVDILKSGSALKALIIGDIFLDKYTFGKVERISTGVSIPTIEMEKRELCLGGAGNVAANIKAFTDKVSIIGRIGQDREADELQGLLEKYGIDDKGLIATGVNTLSKERVYVAKQQLYRLDNCCKEEIELEVFKRLFDEMLPEHDIVVIVDYDYGVCSEEICKYIIAGSAKIGIPTIVTSRSNKWRKYAGADYFVVNKDELLKMTEAFGIYFQGNVIEAGKNILSELSGKGILVTKGEEGLVYIEKDCVFEKRMDAVYPVNVSGAGDTVLSVFAAACVFPKDMNIFTDVLNAAGRLAVLDETTLVLTKDRLISECFSYNRKLDFNNKVLRREYGRALVKSWRNRGESIVLTNGCFDILHSGHVKCLQEAKKYGDRLIVGLNSDASVKRIKGENRPINCEEERAATLASLEMVDCVVIFEEDTAVNLIKDIRPDFYVKGAEYRNKELPEAEYADKIVYVETVEDFSTTNVIRKIVDKACERGSR